LVIVLFSSIVSFSWLGPEPSNVVLEIETEQNGDGEKILEQ
jgi:hypothetical protein